MKITTLFSALFIILFCNTNAASNLIEKSNFELSIFSEDEGTNTKLEKTPCSAIHSEMNDMKNNSTLSFANGFITTWQIGGEKTLTIPTTGTGYNYSVDWGDGVIESGFTGNATHNYISGGTYQVEISGDFPRIHINNNVALREKLISIDQWGDISWSSMERAFRGCENLIYNATDTPDLSNVTSLEEMFSGCESFNGNINDWDVSTITNMKRVFAATISFNQPLNNWNVSNVTAMDALFGNSAFNKDISNWNVSNVNNMQIMFALNSAFDQDLSNWDVSNVTNMSFMFDEAGLSTENYDATLIGWNNLPSLQNSVNFDGGASKYCASQDARQSIIDTYGWGITDGGLDATCPNPDAFVTTWETTSANASITIPTTGGGYSYSVDWGDGTVETGFTGNATHTYASAGSYQVEIIGAFPRIYFNNSGDKDKIQSIDQWGTTTWSSMDSAFFGCSNLASYNAIDTPNLSNVSNMSLMFALCENFNGDIGNWNVSTITNMRGLFAFASTYNQSIENWDVSSVTSMAIMFASASSYNQPMENWNVSSVTNMEFMFQYNDYFNQYIGDWDTSNVTTMESMFDNAINYNQPVENWEVNNVTKMQLMFFKAESFDQPLGNWDVSNVTNMSNMFFIEEGLSTVNYDATLIGWNNLPSLQNNVNFNGGNSKYCTSEGARQNLIDTYGWTINDSGQSDTGCLLDNKLPLIMTWQTDMSNSSPNNQITLPVPSNEGPYTVDWGDGSIESNLNGPATHIYSIPGTYAVQMVGDFRFFFNDSGDKNKILSIDQWGENQWSSMEGAFKGCKHLQINALNAPDLSATSSMSEMFAKTDNFNSNINHWDVSNVNDMQGMFKKARKFNQPLNNWEVSNVSNMKRMFKQAFDFNQSLNDWDVSNVTNMHGMFNEALVYNTSLDGWNTSSVINMTRMFKNADSFDQSLGSWDVSNVADMNGMFKNVTLSTTNYDATLTEWNALPSLQPNVELNTGLSQYCSSEVARQNLTSTYGWVIEDGGLDSSCGQSAAARTAVVNTPKEKVNTINRFAIYPNPAKDYIVIKGLSDINLIEVFDVTAKKISSITNPTNTIDTSSFKAGVYFVKLFTETESKTVKLVKE